MRTNFLKINFVGILLLFAMSCSKTDILGLNNNCENAWTVTVSNELNAYNTALTAYSNDPTTANCSSVKSAAKNYFDALGDALSCVPTASRTQINQAINEAKAEVDSEGCD